MEAMDWRGKLSGFVKVNDPIIVRVISIAGLLASLLTIVFSGVRWLQEVMH